MSFKQKAHRLLVIVALGFGLIAGSPMRPEEVEELLHNMNQPKVAHVLRREEDQPEKQNEANLPR